MKFAVFSLMQWPEDRSATEVYRDELGQMELAERQGYDAAWLAEHHFSRYGIGPSIHLTAAHLAARTSRIRIGTAVTVLPFFHPIRAAEELAMLDQLSAGRIDWGVGRGYQGHEFAGFGVDITKSHLIFREQLEIVKRCWETARGLGPATGSGPSARPRPSRPMPPRCAAGPRRSAVTVTCASATRASDWPMTRVSCRTSSRFALCSLMRVRTARSISMSERRRLR